MPHSYTKIWIHALWATKERAPILQFNIEHKIYQFIAHQLKELGCQAQIINGMPGHIHCLFELNRQKSVSDVIKQIKGSSAHYVNQHQLTVDKFAWQTGYAAFSISESGLERVIPYIQNQKKHHEKHSFQQEYHEFLRLYGIEKP